MTTTEMMAMTETLDLLHGLVLDTGQHWGTAAADFQRVDAEAILDLDGPRMHYCTRARGASKTTDLAAVAIVALLTQAPPASRSYWVAVDADQADLGTDAMRGFIARTPGLSAVLEVKARQIVNRSNLAALEVLPADGASAWGLRGWLYIVDEIAQWPSTRNHQQLWTALLSAFPKAGPTGRLICLTSAGEPSHWAAKVIAHAKASDQWRVSEVPGPVPWFSSVDLDEQRAMLTEASYARLVLNRWTESEDRLTSVDAIERCVRHVGELPAIGGVDYMVSMDIGVTFDRTVVAVGHRERFDDGSVGVVLDVMKVWTPTKGRAVDLVEVGETVAELCRRYGNAPLIFDPYNAIHMTQLLRTRGVRSRPFTFSQSSTGRLGLTLYRLLRDGLLDLPNDEELISELANVRLRENAPGQVRIDHVSGEHDDRAVALALLCHELLEHHPKRRRSIVNTTTAGDLESGRSFMPRLPDSFRLPR